MTYFDHKTCKAFTSYEMNEDQLYRSAEVLNYSNVQSLDLVLESFKSPYINVILHYRCNMYSKARRRYMNYSFFRLIKSNSLKTKV